ncbi:hypothetical protein B296_00015847 [Ensete ventricosum]|uniref:Uncharacterized protein n=1 Tax=Ensete ventricosum TaxID=4639 RepID=A0A427B2G1_ENSVE|nr:hypothetical protein B296_00015847 [Ensete ventricosum]
MGAFGGSLLAEMLFVARRAAEARDPEVGFVELRERGVDFWILIGSLPAPFMVCGRSGYSFFTSVGNFLPFTEDHS